MGKPVDHQHSHRPELHVTVDEGVLDAPAGVLLDGSTWHLFHQYRSEPGGAPRWAHQISEGEPFSWDICDDVLAPMENETQVRAGSVVGTDTGVDLYFTSVTPTGSSVHAAQILDLPTTCEDLAEDPLALSSNVFRTGQVVGDRDGFINFRSPCVVPDWEDNDARDEGHRGWLMLTVTGSSESPDLVVLRSQDGREWTVTGPLRFHGETGLAGDEHLVSPRIIRLRDEVDQQIYDIVITTIEVDGIDISGYLVGQLSGADFEVTTPFTRIDYGHDFSRPRNTNYSPGTVPDEQRYDQAVIFGLLNGVGRLDDATTHRSLADEG